MNIRVFNFVYAEIVNLLVDPKKNTEKMTMQFN